MSENVKFLELNKDNLKLFIKENKKFKIIFVKIILNFLLKKIT